MSDKTGIEWTDATWNPVTGCTEVSPGCDRCYAKTFAERWRGVPGHYFEHGFDVQIRPTKLELPLSPKWAKPRRVFVNSMSDLFHDDVDDEFIAQVFAVMALAPQHTFQLLTKRHGRMRSLLNNQHLVESPSGWLSFEAVVRNVAFNMRNRIASDRGTAGTMPNPDHLPWPLPNVWLGVSVENQQWADIRIPALLDTPAAVRFLSCEPLLGPVDLSRWIDDELGALNRPEDIDWVIVGGESGRGARPMHPDWPYSLLAQCREHGVPFLFKQWGEWQHGSAAPDQRGVDHIIVADGRHEPAAEHWARDDQHRWTSDLIRARDRREPGTERAEYISRVGKKAAGRELDGRTWDEFPRSVGA